MRLKARTKFEYEGIAYKPEDHLDVPNEVAVALINRDLAMIWNLEDHQQRSNAPVAADVPPEPLPDVPPVTLTPTSFTHAAAGGPGGFMVTVTGPGASGTWTVDKDSTATWLTLVSPTAPQSVSGPVAYMVEVNTAAGRTAHFYTNGKTFTVTQTGVAAASTMHRRR